MKLIHLSDLHLGKRVNEFSMIEDQKYILDEILRIIDKEDPDGILLAGDLYDRPVPSADVPSAVLPAVPDPLSTCSWVYLLCMDSVFSKYSVL